MEQDNRPVFGLIAGQGRLPFLVARGARDAGYRVVCVGFRDQAEPELMEAVDRFYWVSLARPGGWIRKLTKEGVRDTIMVGRVAKKRIYTPFRLLTYLPDWRAIRVWYGRLSQKDKRDDTLLKALADELASGGVILNDSTQFCKDQMATEGVMTRTQPGKGVAGDIEFGWEIVKRLSDLDVGQAIAVKEKDIIAVEAIEGTDRMIERAGELCRAGGWTLIKTARSDQDMRFDVPTIGVGTIEKLHRCKATCVVVEAGKTIMIDKEETLALADRYKIAVVGHRV